MAAPKTILVVDDEEDLTWGISRSLSNTKFNLTVHTASSGDEAVTLLSEQAFDLVISDFRMPGKNGLDLILYVRQRHPETRIILMTAYGSQDILRKAEERGSFFYIEKPFDMGYLKQLVFEALDLKNGFNGRLSQTGIRQLVEMNCAAQKSASLSLSTRREKATIYFRNGDVVHAVCGQLEGERAFYSILNWHDGNFVLRNEPVSQNRTISKDWRLLIHQQP